MASRQLAGAPVFDWLPTELVLNILQDTPFAIVRSVCKKWRAYVDTAICRKFTTPSAYMAVYGCICGKTHSSNKSAYLSFAREVRWTFPLLTWATNLSIKTRVDIAWSLVIAAESPT